MSEPMKFEFQIDPALQPAIEWKRLSMQPPNVQPPPMADFMLQQFGGMVHGWAQEMAQETYHQIGRLTPAELVILRKTISDIASARRSMHEAMAQAAAQQQVINQPTGAADAPAAISQTPGDQPNTAPKEGAGG